jgi:hypothetical protein
MFAHTVLTANQVIGDGGAVAFDLLGPSVSAASVVNFVILGGSGTVSTFLVSATVSSGQDCTFAVGVNGVAQPTLKAGTTSGVTSWQGLITIPDNSQLTLLNVSGFACAVEGNAAAGGGNRASLTVLKVTQ